MCELIFCLRRESQREILKFLAEPDMKFIFTQQSQAFHLAFSNPDNQFNILARWGRRKLEKLLNATLLASLLSARKEHARIMGYCNSD